MEDILVYFAIKYEGDWDKIYGAINRKEKVDPTEMKQVLDTNKSNCITLLSENYPSRLKNIYKPPFVLFYKGDINLLNSKNKTIGVVGSRNNSGYGASATTNLVRELVDNEFIIVSGLAKGIDAIAHKSCLEKNGKTIAVVANGINIFYPSANKELQQTIEENGLVISEYPDFKASNKENFPKRNRIIAGLSDSILVTEASNKSGSMITVSRALEMGKDIYCVPYQMGSNSGCNSLIKEGAKLVESVKDILIDM